MTRLSEALRGAGLEVWFDQDELRGGDAWDRKIRQQIRECALFVPVISGNTQARPEGYFRLEWHMAEQRSLLIAKGRPFIVPVVIDATGQNEALVPDAFLMVQWTRIETDAGARAFAAQVTRLLQAAGATPASRSRPPQAAGSNEATEQRAARPPIADYELLRLIGSGSYGDVWLARSVTGLFRAVKVVWRERFETAEPFEREFRGVQEFAAISLVAEGQLALLHVGRNDAAGFFYYVMELADDADQGRTCDPANYVPLTFKEWRQRRGRLSVPEVVAAGATLASGLAELHGRGLVHRDIKPSNVIFVNGAAKLADIGLVTSSSDARTYIGTAGYVPPEGPGTPAADVFALGRVLYELATGLDREEFPRLPADLGRSNDSTALFELNEVLLRAGAADAGRRYRDAGGLAADLQALGAGRSLRRQRRRALAARGAIVAAVVSAIVAGGWYAARKPAAPAANAAELPRAKAIAVLPFDVTGAAADDRLLAEGVNEELRVALGKIAALRIIGRESVLPYADPARRDRPKIAQALDVDTLVEGTVRRGGNRVEMAVRVIDARSARERWAGHYGAEAGTGFALRATMAADIARALGATITSAERERVERLPTANPRAYELYVKARLRYLEINAANGPPLSETDEVARLLEAAVEADPLFAEAYALLARVHAGVYFFALGDQTPARRERARQALAAALRLAPQAPETRFAQGRFLYACERDFAGALPHYLAARAGLPNDVELEIALAATFRRVGRFAESGDAAVRAMALNPVDLNAALLAVQTYLMSGRYVEAATIGDRYPGETLDYAQLRFDAAQARFEVDGDQEKLAEALRRVPAYGYDPRGLHRDFLAAWMTGDVATAARIVADPEFPTVGGLDGIVPEPPALLRGHVALFLDDHEAAARHAAEAVAYYRSKTWPPANQPVVNLELARAAAYSGRKTEALELLASVRRDLLGKDAINDANILIWLWQLFAIIGAPDEALECFRELQRLGLPEAPRLARLNPAWRLLAADPRFDAAVPMPAASPAKSVAVPGAPEENAGRPELRGPKDRRP